MRYISTWWYLDLPPDWCWQVDDSCVTFARTSEDGILQVSAARKDYGLVSDDELKGFASQRIAPNIPLESVRVGAFLGLTTRYRKDHRMWQEWWLRSGRLVIYVTYNIGLGSEQVEQDITANILLTLRSKPDLS
jgi:hypothetical protein